MNRRGFLKFLASVPLIHHIPLIKKIYGDGTDGDVTLTENQTLPHDKWTSYTGGGGGAGGAGGIAIFIVAESQGTTTVMLPKSPPMLTVTANGGREGSGLLMANGSSGSSSV